MNYASSAVSGGVAGAGTGYGMGGVPGAVVGGGLGALIGLLNPGKDPKMKKFETLSPQQKTALNQILQMLQGDVGQGFQGANQYYQEMLNPSEESFNKFSQPYINEYEQQTIPGLAERFASFGGGMGGGTSSSGFGQALGAAGSNLQAQLAALKAHLQQSAAQGLTQQYQNLAGIGIGTPSYGYTYQPGGVGAGQSFLSSYASQGFPGLPSYKTQ